MHEPTRGSGLLEGFLARKRADLADSLIDGSLRGGRLLDIGCGSYPLFLERTRFAGKFGIDPMIEDGERRGITLMKLRASEGAALPFADGFFSAVTMLAVIEHLAPAQGLSLVKEAHRLLAPGGQLVITTPAAWSDRLLRALARVRLVSPEEINEHRAAYRRHTLSRALADAGFGRCETGYFELGLNLWARASK